MDYQEMEKNVSDLKEKLYKKLYEMYGDEYEYIKVDISLFRKKPDYNMLCFPIECTAMMNMDGIKSEMEKFQGPSVENSGAMWDNSNAEKINS